MGLTSSEKNSFAEIFYLAAKISKEKNLLRPVDRRYLYKLGIYLNKNYDLSKKQWLWGLKKVFELGVCLKSSSVAVLKLKDQN